MNILLAYSIRHFCPEKSNETQAGLSAAVLAKAWYETLSELGHVDYVDGLKPPKRLPRKEYDLLVGIQGALTPLHRLAHFKRTILFAVNTHPITRNTIISEFNKRWHVCPTRHVDRNCLHLSVLEDYRHANAVIAVGNDTVRNSFITWGVAPERVQCINYASSLPVAPQDDEHPAPRTPRLLYVATEMCLRKGFDIVCEMLTEAHRSGIAFHADIIGGQGDKTYAAKLASLQERMGERLTTHGWVDSSSAKYRDIIADSDFVIFPSLEEGQAGSVLDAISQGLIPLITKETGIEYSPLGFLKPELESAENKAVLLRALGLSPAEKAAMKQQTIAYYRDHHLPWRKELRKALQAAMALPATPSCHGIPSSTAPTLLRQHIIAPAAWLLSFVAPSRQWRKKLFNTAQMLRLSAEASTPNRETRQAAPRRDDC